MIFVCVEIVDRSLHPSPLSFLHKPTQRDLFTLGNASSIEKSDKKDSMFHLLPTKLVMRIFSHVSPSDIYNIALCCSDFRDFVRENRPKLPKHRAGLKIELTSNDFCLFSLTKKPKKNSLSLKIANTRSCSVPVLRLPEMHEELQHFHFSRIEITSHCDKQIEMSEALLELLKDHLMKTDGWNPLEIMFVGLDLLKISMGDWVAFLETLKNNDKNQIRKFELLNCKFASSSFRLPALWSLKLLPAAIETFKDPTCDTDKELPNSQEVVRTLKGILKRPINAPYLHIEIQSQKLYGISGGDVNRFFKFWCDYVPINEIRVKKRHLSLQLELHDSRMNLHELSRDFEWECHYLVIPKPYIRALLVADWKECVLRISLFGLPPSPHYSSAPPLEGEDGWRLDKWIHEKTRQRHSVYSAVSERRMLRSRLLMLRLMTGEECEQSAKEDSVEFGVEASDDDDNN